MRQNGVREIWGSGGKVVNGWLGIPNSFSAEVMANTDLDSLTIDMQHGIVEYQAAVTMLQAISTTNVTPLVRVPWNDPIPVMKMLDAGALVLSVLWLIIAPSVRSLWGPVVTLQKVIGVLVQPARPCMVALDMRRRLTAV